MSKKQVYKIFLLLKSKPQEFCSLTFFKMVSKYYANYTELVVTNHCSTDNYVGRRRVCPSTVTDLFPSAAHITIILHFI